MIKIKEEWINSEGKYECPYCGKEYTKNGISTHIWRNHGGGKDHGEKTGKGQKGRTAWNKGLRKEDSVQLWQAAEKNSIIQREKAKYGLSSIECYMKNNPEEHKKSSSKGGGLRRMSGKGHKGWYKDYWCDSSWELAYIIYNLEHDIKFERNKKSFEYVYDGKTLKYYPDFIMEDGSYIEIKGYENDMAKAKHQQFKHKLKVLKYKQMKLYLEYAIDKYGTDFIKLYD